MMIDTRLVNARLVDSTGVHRRMLSINDGRLIPDQQTDDVWRTVDASGHLVFPGIIQPADSSGDTALAWAKRGTTTAIVCGPSQNAMTVESAAFDWANAMVVTSPSEFAGALDQGARIVTPLGISPNETPAIDDRVVLRLDDESGRPEDWLTNTSATLVVHSNRPGALGLAGHERVVIEVAAQSLLSNDAAPTWDLVKSEHQVTVTSGGDETFPLLQFLFHEGHVERDLAITRIAEVVSLNPAAAYRLHNKSNFEVGNDGDLVVFDPEADDPYVDAAWPGRVIFSLQRGNILLYNGELHTMPGDGQPAGRP